MKEIQLLSAYFSPTGTTCQVANAIAEGFSCPVIEMDLSKPDCNALLSDNTVLLAAAPVYGGRVPTVALPAPFLAGAAKLLNERAAGYKLPQLFGG